MKGSVHHGSTFCLPASAFRRRRYKSYKPIENVAYSVTLLINLMADPVDYSINAHSIFVDIELSCNTEKNNYRVVQKGWKHLFSML